MALQYSELQSLVPRLQLRPSSQGVQSPPPQSTSVSVLSLTRLRHVDTVGAAVVGALVGSFVGLRLGALLGAFEGLRVGRLLGLRVGDREGDRVGDGVVSTHLVGRSVLWTSESQSVVEALCRYELTAL